MVQYAETRINTGVRMCSHLLHPEIGRTYLLSACRMDFGRLNGRVPFQGSSSRKTHELLSMSAFAFLQKLANRRLSICPTSRLYKHVDDRTSKRAQLSYLDTAPFPNGYFYSRARSMLDERFAQLSKQQRVCLSVPTETTCIYKTHICPGRRTPFPSQTLSLAVHRVAKI